MHGALSRLPLDSEAVTNEELVPLARAGSEEAVLLLIKRHNQQLFRVARGVLRDEAEAEDVVQETYVRAFTNLGSFRGEASLSTWLTQIAINEALGRLRRRRPHAELTELETDGGPEGNRLIMFPIASSSPNPEAETARRQVRHLLEQAVDELPDGFRLVFILREIEGLNVEETAARLDIREETVRTRLHRARRMMRSTLERRLSSSFSEVFPFGGRRCADLALRVVAALKQRDGAQAR